MLSAQEKAIAQFRASGVSAHLNITQAQFIGERGKAKDGASVRFEPQHDDLVDSANPGKERDFVDARDRDRADRADGERDIAAREDGDGEELKVKALEHLTAGDEHDEDAGVCEGKDCKIDHLARAHELLGEHLRRRGAMGASKVSFRFQR